jgi:hypothetical protein
MGRGNSLEVHPDTEVPMFAKSLLAGVVIAALVTPALGAQFWRQWSYPNQRVRHGHSNDLSFDRGS